MNACRAHIRAILDKLGVHSQQAAALQAARLGLLSGQPPGVRPSGEPPSCPTCSAGLAEQGAWSTRSIASAELAGSPRSFTFIYCRACGTVVAVLPGES
jgi:hypothetical protein